METIYLWSAAIAGSLFLGQFALSLIGGADTDLDGVPDDIDLPEANAPSDGATAAEMWFVGMFSLRAILAGVSVFGLSGMALSDQLGPAGCTVAASGCGLTTMYLMGLLIRAMHKLEHDGTVRLKNTLGTEGTVYLTIPEKNSGVGKVTVQVNGRTMEYAARTANQSLPTGTPVLVVAIEPPDIVEVRACDVEPQSTA